MLCNCGQLLCAVFGLNKAKQQPICHCWYACIRGLVQVGVRRRILSVIIDMRAMFNLAVRQARILQGILLKTGHDRGCSVCCMQPNPAAQRDVDCKCVLLLDVQS